MSLKMPSFRTQIIVLVSLITLVAGLLMREFFVSNLSSYQDQISELSTKEKARDIYSNYSHTIDSSRVESFNQEIEGILRDLQKIEIAGDFYSRDIERYSIGIVVLMVILVGIIFLLLFMMITRPLARLLTATEKLKKGNFEIRLKESQYSPLNSLIVSFNGMVNELNENREKLIEAEKQTIWKEMARAMAHEIKNPLTPIRLAAQRLEAKYYEGSDDISAILEKSMGIINEEVDNLQSLVNAFSGFAKMPEAQFDLEMDEELKFIRADMMQMKQVLVNLIQNAIQACPGEPHIALKTQVKDKTCMISIQDHGNGIPDEDLSKIFEPYFTTKKKGTGLGLAIVQRIIRQHGGDIEAQSEPGKGSIFIISLPCNHEN